ncbi:MAG: hypothetical protein AAF491_04110 [Verrucomicrobiota bacterium]
MIQEFNQRQRLRAVGHLFLCLLSTILAYAFFAMAWFYMREAFFPSLSPEWNGAIPLLLVGIVYVFGFIDLTRHGGLRSYGDSSLYFDFDMQTASGTVGDYYLSQATTSAYMVSQVLLCAPIQLIKFLRCLKSIIRDEPSTEADLTRLLGEIREKGKWHEATSYGDRLPLLGHLINMDQVDFSPRKGVVRAV